ncbi:MAG: hypothetical protein LCH32_06405 [Bacteroidetes bacterium]|nr:hypothetical protein [Bacteroidota bacterium]
MRNKITNTIIIILLTFSVYLNYKLVKNELSYYSWKKSVNAAYSNLSINTSKLSEAIKILPLTKKSKFIYLSTWETFCKPCIKEIPLLDSILSEAKLPISCFFLSDMTNDTTIKKKLKINNFQFLYNQNKLISAIHNKFNIKTKTYPLNLLIDTNLNVYYFSSVGINNNEKNKIINTIKSINY